MSTAADNAPRPVSDSPAHPAADPAGPGGAPTRYAGPRQLRRLLTAVMSVAHDLDLATVLERIAEAARELVGARYAALGVLDPTHTHLAEFITVGLDDEERARIGEPPKGHGVLGLLIAEPSPIRLPDLGEHPDSFGFPPGHPPMTSFLGVPLYVRGVVFGKRDSVDVHVVSGAALAVGGVVFADPSHRPAELEDDAV